MNATRTCSVEGCSRRHKARGFCSVHYTKWFRSAPMESRAVPSREDRFWAKVNRSGECWIWTGSTNENGYGIFHDGSKLVRAHRWIYENSVGPIPDGFDVDHVCHNQSACADVPCLHRACVNPHHLDAVTHLVNVLRGRSGDLESAKTHCSKGHQYSAENTIWGRGGRRRTCRTCNKEYQARYNAKRKKAA